MNKYEEALENIKEPRTDYISHKSDFLILEELIARYKDCKNELCQRCGNYEEYHNGACDGCRWMNF